MAKKKDTATKTNASEKSAPIKVGDKVKVHYVGTLEDGEEFDSSEKHGQPLEFNAGAGQMIKGFDDAVIGMKLNDEKNIEIPPEQAYGMSNPELVRDFPKSKMPAGHEIKAGMMLMLNAGGRQLPALVKEVKKDLVTIDLNHPLAGKKLKFKIRVVGVN